MELESFIVSVLKRRNGKEVFLYTETRLNGFIRMLLSLFKIRTCIYIYICMCIHLDALCRGEMKNKNGRG